MLHYLTSTIFCWQPYIIDNQEERKEKLKHMLIIQELESNNRFDHPIMGVSCIFSRSFPQSFQANQVEKAPGTND